MADGSWLKGCRGDGGESERREGQMEGRAFFFLLLLLLTVLFCFFFPCVLGLRCFLLLHYQTEREGHHEVFSLLEHVAGFLSLLVLFFSRSTTNYLLHGPCDSGCCLVFVSFRFYLVIDHAVTWQSDSIR